MAPRTDAGALGRAPRARDAARPPSRHALPLCFAGGQKMSGGMGRCASRSNRGEGPIYSFPRSFSRAVADVVHGQLLHGLATTTLPLG